MQIFIVIFFVLCMQEMISAAEIPDMIKITLQDTQEAKEYSFYRIQHFNTIKTMLDDLGVKLSEVIPLHLVKPMVFDCLVDSINPEKEKTTVYLDFNTLRTNFQNSINTSY